MTYATTATPVSDETKALVEKKMAGEPDAIKQKMGELVDLIKQRAEDELQEAGEITHETYTKAMTGAKDTLKKTEGFFQEQEASLDKSLKSMSSEASQGWQRFVGDVKQASNRFDRAVSAAWSELSGPESTQS